MDTLGLGLNIEDIENGPPEEKDDVQKEKKKRKMSVGVLKKLQAKQAEEARQQLIKQKQEYLKATKTRVQGEWERNHAKALVYDNEYNERKERLLNSAQRLLEIEEAWKNYLVERRKEEEWEQYVKCDGLPDPASVAEMNTYIYVWTEVAANCQMSFCIEKTEEVMKLLKGLEEVMNDPRPDRPPSFLKDMKELRTEVRQMLQEHIDRATFYLFSRIETDMVPVNMTISKYYATCPHFQMSLWAELITPIPSSKGEEIRNPLKVTLEDIDIVVIIPVSLLDIHKVMRVMWLNYDHWSDKCRTYECPPLPSYYNENLFSLFFMEYDWKVDIMNTREHLETVTKRKVGALPHDASLSQEILAWDSEPQRALSEEVMFRECEEEDDLGRQVKEILNEFEVNLRERTILGELLLLEVLHQPPQSQCLRVKHCVTLREKPPRLEPADFEVKYPPPPPDPEEKQEEAQAQVQVQVGRGKGAVKVVNYLEEEKKKLVAVRLMASTSVLWFEQPEIACWDPVRGYWSTEDVHDVELDEEDEHMKFKAGRLGLFGFHVSRYCNLPYEDWTLEPGAEDGEVNFLLKTSKTDLFFKIKAGRVCLETMENAPSKAMNWILGKYYPPAELLTSLKKGGLDLLPGPDAAAYIEDLKPKHVVLERNIYQVWGLFCKSFRFKGSKFNQEVQRGSIVFQAQEVYKDHQVEFCLIESAMCSSYVLDIPETSSSYSPDKAPHMESAIDLYTLLYKNSTTRARRTTDSTCILLIQTVLEFLSLVRPISFTVAPFDSPAPSVPNVTYATPVAEKL